MIQHRPEGDRREGFDGEKAWVQENDDVESQERFALKVAWLANPQNALLVKEYFPNLTVKLGVAYKRRAAYVLESSELDRAYYALYFDKATGLLVQIGHYWELRDYRRIDGVMFPHRIVMSRKGGATDSPVTPPNHA